MGNELNKEDLHISYLTAICAGAELMMDCQRHDEDSTDAIVKQWIDFPEKGRFNSSLRLQLKCTSSKSQYSDDGEVIKYQLKAKNYNDLCAPCSTPIILALLIIPEDRNEWVHWTRKDLILKGCMYWLDLSGHIPTENKEKITVTIDKNNVLNQDTLIAILEQKAKEMMGDVCS